jgi:hypothetical protein
MTTNICEKEMMKSIEELLFGFDRLAEIVGVNKGISLLKHRYLDVCSRGDVIINQLISGLNDNSNNFYIRFMEEHKDNAEEVKMLINDHLLVDIESMIRTQPTMRTRGMCTKKRV